MKSNEKVITIRNVYTKDVKREILNKMSTYTYYDLTVLYTILKAHGSAFKTVPFINVKLTKRKFINT